MVLPTGAGKTRVALAAIAETGLPTAVLCPTRVVAAAWVDELVRHFPDEPIGMIGDGHRSVERITVLTFESAYRHMDTIGDRFGRRGPSLRRRCADRSARILGLDCAIGAYRDGAIASLVGPIEVVGYWTPEYLAQKAALLDLADVAIVLCIDETHVAQLDASRLGDPRLLPFRKRIDAAKLIERCERLLRARRFRSGARKGGARAGGS